MTTDEGERLRDEGIANAETGAQPWGAIAFSVLEEMAADLLYITSDDVWDELDRRRVPRPEEGRAMGAVMQRGIRAGIIHPHGFTSGTNPRHHRDVIPFAAAICHDCKAPVAIVRRTVEVPCDADCGWDGCQCHTHPLPGVGPFTVVDEQGERHECAVVAA